jgi:hypothetical protein
MVKARQLAARVAVSAQAVLAVRAGPPEAEAAPAGPPPQGEALPRPGPAVRAGILAQAESPQRAEPPGLAEVRPELAPRVAALGGILFWREPRPRAEFP